MIAGPGAGSPPDGFIDLHLHSTASDGTMTPSQVVSAAIGARLRAIALTDHDTVAGVAEARTAAGGTALVVIAGVELSAYQQDEEVHLLGLHLASLQTMEEELALFRTARHERALEMVSRLNAIGVKLDFSDVLDAARGGALGRPHVARALIENGWARDQRDAFDRYLAQGRPAFLEKRRLGLADAIDLVHRSGGVAVLAHPGAAASPARLAALAGVGLDGVEVLHPSHGHDDRRRLLETVRTMDLLPSGGSDSHGALEGPRAVGSMQVPGAWLDEHSRRLARTRPVSDAG